MPSTADLQARLEALKAARDSGVLRVRYGETDTTYRSLDEIDRIIAAIETDLARASGAQRVRTIRLYTRSGW